MDDKGKIKRDVDLAIKKFYQNGYSEERKGAKAFSYYYGDIEVYIKSNIRRIGIYVFIDNSREYELKHFFEYNKEDKYFVKRGHHENMVSHLKNIILLENLGVA